MEESYQFWLLFLMIIGFICFIIGFLSSKESLQKPLYITGGICVFIGLGGIVFYPKKQERKEKSVRFVDFEEEIYPRRSSRVLVQQKIDQDWPKKTRKFIKNVRDPRFYFTIKDIKKDIPQMDWKKGTSGYILDRQTLTKEDQIPKNQLLKKIQQNTTYKRWAY